MALQASSILWQTRRSCPYLCVCWKCNCFCCSENCTPPPMYLYILPDCFIWFLHDDVLARRMCMSNWIHHMCVRILHDTGSDGYKWKSCCTGSSGRPLTGHTFPKIQGTLNKRGSKLSRSFFSTCYHILAEPSNVTFLVLNFHLYESFWPKYY